MQERQAYLERRVKITRNCAGMTSSRSDTSSPMQRRPPRQVQIKLSGSMISSTRGRRAGREPRLAARDLGLALPEGLSASRAWFLYYEECPDERASNVLSSAAIEFYNDGYRNAEDIAAMLIGTCVGLFSTRVNAPTSLAIH